MFGLKFINSPRSLPCDKPVASCKALPPHNPIHCFLFQALAKHFLHTIRSTVSSFKYQHLVFSLPSPSCCFRLLPAFYLAFSNMLHKPVPAQAVTNPVSRPFIVCRIFLSPLTLRNPSIHLGRYSPFWALASPRRPLHSTPFSVRIKI